MEKSQSIKEIAKALQCFQGKMAKIKKDATNPFFKSKYASLSTILEHIQTPLSECGLSFAQFPDGSQLTTLLMHGESGEWIQAGYDICPIKNDPQAIGSALTYARRYALSGILGINVDDDDDGNLATGKKIEPAKAPISPQAEKPKELPELVIPSQEFIAAEKWLKTEGNTVARIQKQYRFNDNVAGLLFKAQATWDKSLQS